MAVWRFFMIVHAYHQRTSDNIASLITWTLYANINIGPIVWLWQTSNWAVVQLPEKNIVPTMLYYRWRPTLHRFVITVSLRNGENCNFTTYMRCHPLWTSACSFTRFRSLCFFLRAKKHTKSESVQFAQRALRFRLPVDWTRSDFSMQNAG